MSSLVDFVLHFDKHLLDFISAYGAWVYALLFAQRVGPTGRVVAVEASAHNADVSRRNRHLNRTSNLADCLTYHHRTQDSA